MDMQLPYRIVLVETSHPGNIGATARAMKTMGMTDMVLVNPERFPDSEATARASGADDVLANARVVDSFVDAIGDCGFVVGASARLRSLPWPTVDPHQAAATITQHRADGVAVVFGPEQSGLDNEHLARCQQLVHIPANPGYSSLNLAQAVQVVCYELRMASLQESTGVERERRLASTSEVELFHEHLEAVLTATGFLNPDHPKQLLLRLRRLFNRAQLDDNEVNILRGILSNVDPRRKR
jgi:tRNA (cytidine32/uridine32-2'-O)-methyltransferase